AARFLPQAPAAGTDATRGKDIQERLKSPWFDSATGLGLAAAKRFNQPVPAHCATKELNGHASKD
ncbi:MAG: hypothetical protein JOZ57_16545, partial [Abitibacteriaceae bacterium]|nr:hypothetical protein [Abditibacteriaceae bacterium]